ncbi:hypothetical protein [Streptomyces sp. H27-G5]|uniref:hypothetical protein n=1 Tax=Streptomyces sp. H27-G5 TaxID=2996698 RepID=UPI002D1E3972|nr:hypothetical protein [Streptomyces sp. H27-G5]
MDAERNLDWACAGHPPPLLLRGSEAIALDTGIEGRCSACCPATSTRPRPSP